MRWRPEGKLDGGRECQDAQHADKGDGGSVESLGDESIHAILLRNLDTEVGHVLLLFKFQPGDTCTASYHVTKGTLQYILGTARVLCCTAI